MLDMEAVRCYSRRKVVKEEREFEENSAQVRALESLLSEGKIWIKCHKTAVFH